MPPGDDKNRIEDLKRSLYSRSAPDVRTRRKLRFFSQAPEIKTDWEHPAAESEDGAETKHRMSLPTKILIGSIIFCIIAVSLGAYVFLNGANLISANNIEVVINGPVSMAGGTPASFDITVTNKNSVVLESATLSVQFPAGSTDPSDASKPLDTLKIPLGNLQPGVSVTKSASAMIFGEENLQKEVVASVTYGVAGSSSVFTKDQNYDVLINSSPVNVSVTGFKEITSGQAFDLAVAVKSSSANILRGVILKATYPFGYTFASASPAPASSDNTAWTIGDLPPGAERVVTIHGTLVGEDGDLRAFHFTAGSQGSDSALSIGTAFSEGEADVTIKKPFVSLSITTDNDSSSGDYVGRFGRSVNVTIHWANNLPETLSNVIITAHLSGSAYDKSQVTSPVGYFRSSTDDIIWSQQTSPELASVAAGASGSLSFAVTPTDTGTQSNPVVDPEITIATSVQGDRTSASGVPESATTAARNIKVASNISLSGRIVRTGPFLNTGPIPPVAEQQTTYTVVWTVDNTSSSVSNAVVTATLPPYVSWLGQTNPSSENVSYDKNSGTITWNLGSLGAYSSGASTRRELDFQISFLPSVDQVGQAPVLINKATLTATDVFTRANLQSNQDYLTSSFSTDPSFKNGDETVTSGR